MAFPVGFVVQGAMAMKNKMSQANKALEETKKGATTWLPVPGNPYHEFQRWMYGSTKRKFEAQGISPSGRKKWWKPLKASYQAQKSRAGRGQKILSLRGRLGNRFYANLLKKKIKKNRPNAKMVLLTAPVEWAQVHQKGSRRFNIPKRPFLMYTKKDLLMRVRLFGNYCFGTFEAYSPGVFKAFPLHAAGFFKAY